MDSREILKFSIFFLIHLVFFFFTVKQYIYICINTYRRERYCGFLLASFDRILRIGKKTVPNRKKEKLHIYICIITRLSVSEQLLRSDLNKAEMVNRSRFCLVTRHGIALYIIIIVKFNKTRYRV